MTETTEAQPVRFAGRARGASFAKPLPPRVESLLTQKQRRDHERLAERVEESGREVVRLRRAISEAPARDREAGKQAALDGKELPASSEPALRAELDQATRTRQVLEEALRESADRLLAAAEPKARELVDDFDREVRDGAESVRARIADLTDALRELGDLHSEASWTRALADGYEVHPYRGGHGYFTETAGHVTTVGEAFTFELGRMEEHRREFQRRAKELADQNAQFDAEREQRAVVARETPDG